MDKKKVKARLAQMNKYGHAAHATQACLCSRSLVAAGGACPVCDRRRRKLEWFDEGAKASKFERIVVFKNMFKPEEIEADPGLILDLKEDLRSECEKLGEVTNVAVFDKHPDGICSVKFRSPEAAHACIELMNGRFFAGRKLEVFTYDGKTRYDQVNTEDIDDETRLKRYGDWLEGRDTSAAAAAEARALLEGAPPPGKNRALERTPSPGRAKGSDDEDDNEDRQEDGE